MMNCREFFKVNFISKIAVVKEYVFSAVFAVFREQSAFL